MSHEGSPASIRHTAATHTKLAFVMVGLPARGKTFIARKVARYLSWLGHRTQVFNVGAYRRAHLGSRQPHSFFDSRNEEGNRARLEMAERALSDMLAWLGQGGEVAIYDATNSTRERRAFIADACAKTGIEVVFIESICDNPDLIAANIRATKAHSPDYAQVEAEEAVADFEQRIAHYAEVYEEVDRQDGRYIKIIDVGETVVAHRIDGYLPSRLVFYLLSFHLVPRPIWLTRHGESQFNVEGRIGGDSSLTSAGLTYAQALAKFVREQASSPVVWTSTLQRTIETAKTVNLPYDPWKALDEIDAGICDGLTYAEIASQMPQEYAARRGQKFRYRYPRGESYADVIDRLEPVIFEIERERRPLLIVAHQAVLRALYAYLMDQKPEACPTLPIPLHTVIELTPTAYGCEERRFALLGPDDSTNATESSA